MVMANPSLVRLRIASASLNQTVYDFAVNVKNICAAIDRAVADQADILSLEELTLTGYAADDYHQWNKNNDLVWLAIQKIKNHAFEKNPNLVISFGAPWHYADKTRHADDPEYNIENLPYNTQWLITRGRVVAITAKSLLANGPAEYERRHFIGWPPSQGVREIILPDGSRAPFGKPVTVLSEDGRCVTLVQEICADAWPGLFDSANVNAREQQEARFIIGLSQKYDLSVILNPSSSKPEPANNKELLRIKGLCETGSEYCGLYVFTNCLGSASGLYAAEGGQIFAQNGKVIHHNQRYSFGDISYSSVTVDVPSAARVPDGETVPHEFSDNLPATKVGGKSLFDAAYEEGIISTDELRYEEYLRSVALWLRDYIRKQTFACQGYVISLSGGKDSAYGALAVTTMVDLDVAENGIRGFFERFKDLNYENDILKILSEQGEAAAVCAIKQHLLTCIYMSTENSSDRTRHAARFLIEGDAKTPGIGGKFHAADVQGIWDTTLAAFNGLGFMPPDWANPRDDLLLQNMQARVRLPLPWAISAREGKIALTTSNESEAALGYTTAGGDMHLGGANPIGGIPKNIITESLLYFEKRGLIGAAPAPSLHYTNLETPTAELRKADTTRAGQTDEDDLGFTYRQSDFMEEHLLVRRESPLEVYQHMRAAQNLFPNDPAACRDILIQFAARRWPAAQFKRVMSPIAPHVGRNVDPHQSVRTTILGDHFNTGCALMTLEAMAEILGGQAGLEQHFDRSLDELRAEALLNSKFKHQLIFSTIQDLLSGGLKHAV